MTTATLSKTKTVTAPKADAYTILRFPVAAGWTLCNATLESLGRKAAIDAHAHRLTHYGADWMEADATWKSRDAVKAVGWLEGRICRELNDDERGAFVVAMIDMLHDLV